MRILIAICLLSGVAGADIRGAVTFDGTLRTYDNSPSGESHHGVGPGLALEFVQSAPEGFVQGLHLGWHYYDEDSGNGDARFQLWQVHYLAEWRFEGGAVGAGVGLDAFHGSYYASDGQPSYTETRTMVALDVHVGFDILPTRSGTWGVVAGFGLFPLFDVAAILSQGEGGIGWRGVIGSLGISYRSSGHSPRRGTSLARR